MPQSPLISFFSSLFFTWDFPKYSFSERSCALPLYQLYLLLKEPGCCGSKVWRSGAFYNPSIKSYFFNVAVPWCMTFTNVSVVLQVFVCSFPVLPALFLGCSVSKIFSWNPDTSWLVCPVRWDRKAVGSGWGGSPFFQQRYSSGKVLRLMSKPLWWRRLWVNLTKITLPTMAHEPQGNLSWFFTMRIWK